MALSKVVSNRITNEKGDTVYVRISAEPLQGTPGMLLFVSGSDADSEMHLTDAEGRELLLLLSKFLKSGRARS